MANIYLLLFVFPKKLFVEFAGIGFSFCRHIARIRQKQQNPAPSSGDAFERFPSGRSSRARAKEGAQERERERERERDTVSARARWNRREEKRTEGRSRDEDETMKQAC